jgi:hypothetical protein
MTRLTWLAVSRGHQRPRCAGSWCEFLEEYRWEPAGVQLPLLRGAAADWR